MSAETIMDAIRAEADQEELKWRRKRMQEFYSLLASDGRISALAIYTDDRLPEGQWEDTGAQLYGAPILRQSRRNQLSEEGAQKK